MEIIKVTRLSNNIKYFIKNSDGHWENLNKSHENLLGDFDIRMELSFPTPEPCETCKIIIGGMLHHNYCYKCGRQLKEK